MFSIDARQLPSLRSYERVKNFYNKTRKPPNLRWDVNARPLKDARSTHFAITELVGGAFGCTLYSTHVVIWRSPDEFVLDLQYKSISTRKFAALFTPFGDIAFSYNKRQCINFHGQYFVTDYPFYFKRVADEWTLTSKHTPPTKIVVDVEKAKSLKPVLNPFLEWIDVVWAMSNDTANGNSHPWVNKPRECQKLDAQDKLYSLIQEKQFDKAIKLCLPYSSSWNNGTNFFHASITAKELKKRIRKKVYEEQEVFVQIPYNKTFKQFKEETLKG